MANRKQFFGEMKVDLELTALLEASRKTPVTKEQLVEQRISFAFGNSPDSKFITKDTVRKTSHSILLAS